MSFWKLSSGVDVRSGVDGTFEVGGGSMEPIPDNTSVLASIDEAKWANRDGNHYVELRWNVLAPDEYKNRKVFQKLWIKDYDPRAKDPEKKKEKAMRMFAAIDKNCGGKLMVIEDEPTDAELSSNLCDKPMIADIMVWEINNDNTGEKSRGNWIRKVSARTNGEVKAAPAKERRGSSAPSKAAETDVPF
jgi:hypothetical protein